MILTKNSFNQSQYKSDFSRSINIFIFGNLSEMIYFPTERCEKSIDWQCLPAIALQPPAPLQPQPASQDPSNMRTPLFLNHVTVKQIIVWYLLIRETDYTFFCRKK